MHIIRLRGPWQKQHDDDRTIRVEVPDRDAAVKPEACYRRRFNRPTGLQSQDRVCLRISDWTGLVDSIQLNGQPLVVTAPPLTVDITAKLLDHNELSVRLLVDPQTATSPRLTGEVSLAIDDGSVI